MAYAHKLWLPYSYAVHSGGKSIHFVVCLQDPMPEAQFLELLGQLKRCWRIFDITDRRGGGKFDPNTLTANRLSRMPGGLRANGARQEVLVVRQRIPNVEFLAWVASQDKLPVASRPVANRPGELSHFVERLLATGYPADGKKAVTYGAVKDLRRAGWEEGRIWETLEPLALAAGQTPEEFRAHFRGGMRAPV